MHSADIVFDWLESKRVWVQGHDLITAVKCLRETHALDCKSKLFEMLNQKHLPKKKGGMRKSSTLQDFRVKNT